MHNTKKLFPFLFFFITNYSCLAVDPFSKITVTSGQAVFKKQKEKKKLAGGTCFSLQYDTNVCVTFADETKITADHLQILVRVSDKKTKEEKKEKKEKSEEVERVLFTDNVCMKQNNRSVIADKVTLLVSEKTCLLRGNVTIEQTKENEKDIPMKTVCQQAKLNWDSDEVALEGSAKKPVSTTIALGGALRGLRR